MTKWQRTAILHHFWDASCILLLLDESNREVKREPGLNHGYCFTSKPYTGYGGWWTAVMNDWIVNRMLWDSLQWLAMASSWTGQCFIFPRKVWCLFTDPRRMAGLDGKSELRAWYLVHATAGKTSDCAPRARQINNRNFYLTRGSNRSYTKEILYRINEKWNKI